MCFDLVVRGRLYASKDDLRPRLMLPMRRLDCAWTSRFSLLLMRVDHFLQLLLVNRD